VRELGEEFSSAPRQIHADDFGCGHAADSAAVSKLRHEEAEVRAYEEANFSRLALSKEQKRELRRRHAAVERGAPAPPPAPPASLSLPSLASSAAPSDSPLSQATSSRSSTTTSRTSTR